MNIEELKLHLTDQAYKSFQALKKCQERETGWATKIPFFGWIYKLYCEHQTTQAWWKAHRFAGEISHMPTDKMKRIAFDILLKDPKTEKETGDPLEALTPKTVEGFEREIDQALIEVFGACAQSENFRQTELPLYYCLSTTQNLAEAISIAEELYPGKKPIIDMKIDLKKALALKAKLKKLAHVLSQMPEPSKTEIKGRYDTLEKALSNRVLNRTVGATDAWQIKAGSFALFLSYLPECSSTHADRSVKDKQLAFRIAFELSTQDDFPSTVDLIMKQLTKDQTKLLSDFQTFLRKKTTGDTTPEDFLKQLKREEASPAPISSTGSLSPSTEEASSGSPPPVRNRAATPPPIVTRPPPRSAKAPQPIMASSPFPAAQQTSHPVLKNLYEQIREILARVFIEPGKGFYRGIFSTYLALSILLEDKNSTKTQKLLDQEANNLGWQPIDLAKVEQLNSELGTLLKAIYQDRTENPEAIEAIQGKFDSLEKGFSTRILEAVGINRSLVAQEFYRKGRVMAQKINDFMNGRGNPLLLPLSS